MLAVAKTLPHGYNCCIMFVGPSRSFSCRGRRRRRCAYVPCARDDCATLLPLTSILSIALHPTAPTPFLFSPQSDTGGDHQNVKGAYRRPATDVSQARIDAAIDELARDPSVSLLPVHRQLIQPVKVIIAPGTRATTTRLPYRLHSSPPMSRLVSILPLRPYNVRWALVLFFATLHGVVTMYRRPASKGSKQGPQNKEAYRYTSEGTGDAEWHSSTLLGMLWKVCVAR